MYYIKTQPSPTFLTNIGPPSVGLLPVYHSGAGHALLRTGCAYASSCVRLSTAGPLTGFGAFLAGLMLVLFQNRGDGAPGVVDLDLAGWGTCLLFLYWISYGWMVAHRGRIGDDPLSFTIRNQTSRVLILITTAAFARRWL